MKARHPGRCVRCGGIVSIGDEIMKSYHGGWEHDPSGDRSGCPADADEDEVRDMLAMEWDAGDRV